MCITLETKKQIMLFHCTYFRLVKHEYNWTSEKKIANGKSVIITYILVSSMEFGQYFVKYVETKHEYPDHNLNNK